MKVEFLNLKAQHSALEKQFEKTFRNVLRKGRFVLGEEVESFEAEFADYCGTRYAVGVSSGTEALHLSLLALGIGRGDEVVTAPNTYIATALAISQTGARPVFVDVDEATGNLDPEKLRGFLKKRRRAPKAVIPVHLYGNPADMDGITRVARKYGMKVLEDACQAHGAYYNERRVGSIGDAGCFSFYPAKNLGALGDGGAVVTDSGKIFAKLKLLRNYGQPRKYHHVMKGFNGRLDELQAAFLRVKLKKLDKWNRERRKRARLYTDLLKGVAVTTPVELPGAAHVYHLYVIALAKRNALQKYLEKRGVGTALHYPVPVHLQKVYRDLGHKRGSFPVAERLSKRILSLPLYPELPLDDVKKVCRAIKKFYGAGGGAG
ncbi:MAG: DegT/DnrJ/EryC1/StrS family aminotransferase [Thermodesulfobacteriota bacterium]